MLLQNDVRNTVRPFALRSLEEEARAHALCKIRPNCPQDEAVVTWLIRCALN